MINNGNNISGKVGSECCGCGACSQICQQKCIHMTSNEDGFLYPQVNQEFCVQCGLCTSVCPVLHDFKSEQTIDKEAWGIITKNKDLLITSSSGGVFTLLAQEVLKQGGCVFGASFSEDYKTVSHIMIETENELWRLQGSKYLQSDTNNSFLKVKQELMLNRKVLYSGTPCQIAGLKSFLGKEYEKLICVDVICHGTPSPALWKKYLGHIESKNNSSTTFVSFRNKNISWRQFSLYIEMSEKCYNCSHDKDPYMKMFLKNYCLRESCYHCKSKENGFCSDLTIGDFWGVEHVVPEFNNDMGVSLVLPHTKKGKALLEKILPMANECITEYDAAILHNSALNHSVLRPKERDCFFSDLRTLTWEKFVKKYTNSNFKAKIRNVLSTSVLGKIKRKLLNRN